MGENAVHFLHEHLLSFRAKIAMYGRLNFEQVLNYILQPGCNLFSRSVARHEDLTLETTYSQCCLVISAPSFGGDEERNMHF